MSDKIGTALTILCCATPIIFTLYKVYDNYKHREMYRKMSNLIETPEEYDTHFSVKEE